MLAERGWGPARRREARQGGGKQDEGSGRAAVCAWRLWEGAVFGLLQLQKLDTMLVLSGM